MVSVKSLILVLVFCVSAKSAWSSEQVLGNELIQPGIAIVFAGADAIEATPVEQGLTVDKADFRIVARVNWSRDPDVLVPGNAPRGGFVAFLKISVEITNQSSGKAVFATLIPHINLADNFHYSSNIALPGNPGDKYDVTFFVNPPEKFHLSFLKDWRGAHGAKLFGPKEYTYGTIDFSSLIGQ